MLIIEDLTKTFGNKKVLNNISLSIKKGSVSILLGVSGSGKTTILRILNGLDIYTKGIIKLDGKELNTTYMAKPRPISMVFQQFNLFSHMTVINNIIFPLQKVLNLKKITATKRARELLQHYDLLDYSNESTKSLSGGQKQRLALARTLAMKPQVICLDEPTSALDPFLTSYVADHIKNLADKGYTVLVASHDTLLFEKLACTIHFIQEGRIIESATSSVFWKKKKSYPHITAFVQGTKHRAF